MVNILNYNIIFVGLSFARVKAYSIPKIAFDIFVASSVVSAFPVSVVDLAVVVEVFVDVAAFDLKIMIKVIME